MPMREVEWQALMATIRDAIAEIAEGSGYGRVEIVCAAGKPREIHIDRSLRFLQTSALERRRSHRGHVLTRQSRLGGVPVSVTSGQRGG